MKELQINDRLRICIMTKKQSRHDFIFITDVMIDKMRQSPIKSTLNGHLETFRKKIGEQHFHILNGEPCDLCDEMIADLKCFTNGWDENLIVFFQTGVFDGAIAICNFDDYIDNLNYEGILSIKDFLREFVKAKGIVLIGKSYYRTVEEIEELL